MQINQMQARVPESGGGQPGEIYMVFLEDATSLS
jgi:hypothetical protein